VANESGIDINRSEISATGAAAVVLYLKASAIMNRTTLDSAMFPLDVEYGSFVNSLTGLDVNGPVFLYSHAKADLGDALIVGNVYAMRFSDLALDWSEVAGWVWCASASDAVGTGTSVGLVHGCPSWYTDSTDGQEPERDEEIGPLNLGAGLEPIPIR
jgi:hypothetical protein